MSPNFFSNLPSEKCIDWLNSNKENFKQNSDNMRTASGDTFQEHNHRLLRLGRKINTLRYSSI